MSNCPTCGRPPGATTENAETGQPYYECAYDGTEWEDTDS